MYIAVFTYNSHVATDRDFSLIFIAVQRASTFSRLILANDLGTIKCVMCTLHFEAARVKIHRRGHALCTGECALVVLRLIN